MTTTIIIICIVAFIVVVLLIIDDIINYSTYKYMTYRSGLQVGKATYEQFKFRFERITDWEHEYQFPNSLFCYIRNNSYRKAYLHAGQIIFDEKAMLLGRIDYLHAKLLIKKTIKQFKENEKPRETTWEKIEAEEIIDKLK